MAGRSSQSFLFREGCLCVDAMASLTPRIVITLQETTKVRVKVAPWAKFKSLIYNTYQTPNQSRKALDHCSTSRSCSLQHPLSCVAFFFFLRPRRQALLRSGTILCLPPTCLFVNKERRRRGIEEEVRGKLNIGYLLSQVL